MKRNSLRHRKIGLEVLESRRVLAAAPFSLAVLPDTQFYVESFPATFDAQTQWIVDNLATRSIKFVSHVGDIVENGETGVDQNLIEWQRADASMDRLDGNLATTLDGLVPYSVALGNHDYAVVSNKLSGSTRYQQYFGPSRYEGRSWYLEYSDTSGGHAQIFEAGGYRFLHITVQWESLDSDLNWAQGVIDRNPGLPTILTTHSYLNPATLNRQATVQGTSSGVPNPGNTGEQVFQKWVSVNPMVFLVMNGHFTGELTRVSTNRVGQPVIEMVADYQGLQNGGDGWMRMLEFRPEDNRIDFTTYSPTRNEFQTDANSQFSIPINFVERFGVPQPMNHRVSVFQNGRTIANTVYNGTIDTQLRQSAPDTVYGTNPAELMVDFPEVGLNNASQALVQFTNLFGAGANQIPSGAQIVEAKLVVDSTNPGSGANLHRLLTSWNTNATWNTWNSGVQPNDIEAVSSASVLVGSPSFNPLVPVQSEFSIDVTSDVRVWASGAPNHGWAFLPRTNGTDAWAFSPSEVASIGDRPSLKITWLPPTGSNVPSNVTASNALATYTEDGSPILLFPTATVTDSDSANFDSGSVRVELTENASFHDRLSIRHEGNASGQIGISNGFISYGGIVVGQLSEGLGAKPLTISLNVDASRVAVQAILRNIQFHNVSDAPSTLTRSVRMYLYDGDDGLSNSVGRPIQIVAVNDGPSITVNRTTAYYSAGGEAIGLIPNATFTDPDSLDLNGGLITITLAVNATNQDSLSIRHTGNGVGQVGVVGNTVFYSGTAIGTFTGGTIGIPLRVTLNGSSNESSAQALLRSVVFHTSNLRLKPDARLIAIEATDGDGGTSSVASIELEQSLARRYRFQEAVDSGQGHYVGAADIQIRQSNPNTSYPIGSTPSDGLLIDYDAATANSQVLLRFDNIFGVGQGKIPVGSTIVSARLILDVNNPGDGGSMHRMLTSWNAQTETWNTFGSNVAPRNAIGGVQPDNAEARSEYRAQAGTLFGVGDIENGRSAIGVTHDVQAWSSGAQNFGWLLQGWSGQANGWAFSPSESAIPADRPALEIEWIPSTIPNTSFQQGVNGYTGTIDTTLEEDFPTRVNASLTTNFVDYNSPDTLNPPLLLPDQSQVLLRFDQLNGTQVNQIPPGSMIHAAVLTLASNTSDAPGAGGQFYRMQSNWNASSTWNGFGAGVQANGIEARSFVSLNAGDFATNFDVEGGLNDLEVTEDIQAWTQQPSSNLGWAILPWSGGTNGWGIQSSESSQIHERPQLRVFYTPRGIRVTPPTSLTTTELGGSATFSIVLDTPPSSDVSIGLSVSNSSEAFLSVSTVLFTPSTWDIPQHITVTGIDDFLIDGNASYQVIIAPAVSGDSNYQGFNPIDLNLTNIDNGQRGIAPTVTDIIAAGSTWSTAFVDAIDGGGPSAGNGLGYSLTANQIIPNAGVDRIYIQFSEPVTGFSASSFALLGVNISDYASMASVSYDPVVRRGVIQLFSSITRDRLRIGVSDAVRDADMNRLDGDANGVAGSHVNFLFNVLIGDANLSGSTNGGDLPAFALAFNTSVGNPVYNPQLDWNADGSVNGGDLPYFANFFNRSIPSTDPGSLNFPPPLLPLPEKDAGSSEELSIESLEEFFSYFDYEEEN
jgi:hypothetical protein